MDVKAATLLASCLLLASQAEAKIVKDPHKNNQYNRVVIVHMVFMILVFFVLFPLGAFVARFGRTSFKWFPHHRNIQLLATFLLVIGFFLGCGVNWTEGSRHLHNDHQKAGFAIFFVTLMQAALGQFGHMLWRSKRIRWQNYLHMIFGVALIPIAAWNAGLGFEKWDWHPGTAPAKVIYAWTGFLGLVYIIGLAVGIPKERAADAKAQQERADVSSEDSSDLGKEDVVKDVKEVV